ncbi:MAG: molecular chaperone DnaK [Myxococcota bacterium]
MSRVIGIDLGTTNSCVAALEHGQPVVIPNTGGYKTTPSYFAVTEAGKRLVGHLAKRQAITNAANTVYAAKRLIGRPFDTPEVRRHQENVAYELVEGPNQDTRVKIADRTYTIPEISAAVLREMKRVAEEYLGEPVQKAVITVPAYFNDSQRQTTRDAGRLAGLEVLRIINEPTAAALAYGMGRPGVERIAVYDLGGGTFDISILQMGNGVLEVLATGGDTHLGGEDFDRRLVQALLEGFEAGEGIDLRDDRMALQRLKDASEKAKCDLSQLERTELNLPFIASGPNGEAHHLQTSLERPQIEAMMADLIERTGEICRSVLHDAGLQMEDLGQVLLVGGQTRMPRVQAFVRELFGRAPHKGVNPDEVVAIGAALQASMLAEDVPGPLLVDVTPLSLGIETKGGHFARMIDRNTKVPATRNEVFTTTRDNQDTVRIRVLQGESDSASENDLLGEFSLCGIPAAPKGEPEIDVTFDIDVDGIVSVSAKDRATNQAQSVKVDPRGTLSSQELEKLMREHATEDGIAARD